MVIKQPPDLFPRSHEPETVSTYSVDPDQSQSKLAAGSDCNFEQPRITFDLLEKPRPASISISGTQMPGKVSGLQNNA
jgi:hypothetical protein